MKKSIRHLSLVLALWLLAAPLTGCKSADAPQEDHSWAETEREETKPVETEPVETEPVEAKPVETKPVETEPVETEPVETEPVETEPVVRVMPSYFQTDYPEELFAGGTIASEGCSITSLAMVASFLTGHSYQPDELAKWFGPYSGTLMKRLEYASDELKLPWERAANWHVVRKALHEGKLAIVMMGAKSQFTSNIHFVVMTGVTPEGKYLVKDPNKANYDHWALREGFQNGFEEWQISSGYQGGWIYDPAAMPEEPFIFVPPDYSGIEPRYPGIELTKNERVLLASVIWIEAQGEPFAGQQAIAEVVLNRLVADNFPNSVKAILYDDNQFPSLELLDKAEPTQTQHEAIERALHGPYILEKDVVFFATRALNKNVWGTIGGHTFCYQWNVSPEKGKGSQTAPEETVGETVEETGPEQSR